MPWAIPGFGVSNFEARIDPPRFRTAESINARVIDYKSPGRCPEEEPRLDNGKELQRCLYAVAVKALLGQVTVVEAALLYPGSDGNLYSLSDPSVQTEELTRFLQLAEQMLRSSRADLSSVRERRAGTTTWLLSPSANAEGCISRKRGGAGCDGGRFTQPLGSELMPELSDATHRRRALTDHSATLLAEAGAGTGMTSLLAGRVALASSLGSPSSQRCSNHLHRTSAASELLQRIQEYVRELVTGECS